MQCSSADDNDDDDDDDKMAIHDFLYINEHIVFRDAVCMSKGHLTRRLYITDGWQAEKLNCRH